MELPIDHFRLLGVTSTAGAEEILRVFQLRLDRTPDKGFTYEVLAQRSELLRLSADLLTDQSQRQEYENALAMGASGLELSSSREVAGLILLWEADFSYEAFKLSRKALQPPQTPALGSSREADLALIAALSCRDASLQQQDQRRYAFAAEVLQEGIQLLQRMGKLSEQRQQLELDLELLLPFRILDLLSRDLDDFNSHQEGLNLLDSFIIKRGGLEGRSKLRSYGGLSQSDFELFFQQIRNFLTAQEQVDLFSSWYRQGSKDAGFLAAISLVASGFAFKKPENLQEARKYLKNLNYQGLDPMPLIGCIDLLLGDIQQVEARFNSTNDISLRDWFNNYPGEELAAYCHYCRNWLQNDVLHGFRDIDISYPDLDDWFADREVQEYLEQLENSGTRALARAGRTFLSSFSAESKDPNISIDSMDPEGSLPMPGGVRDLSNDENEVIKESTDFIDGLFPRFEFFDFVRFRIASIKSTQLIHKFTRNPIPASLGAFILLFCIGVTVGLVNSRGKNSNNVLSRDNNTSKVITISPKSKGSLKVDDNKNKEDEISENDSTSKNLKLQAPEINGAKFVALTVENPNEQQIKNLIENWLSAKADVLSGKKIIDFSPFARENLSNRVYEERSKDRAKGEKQIIQALVSSVIIESQNNNRISVRVDLQYKDQRLNSTGKVTSETIIPSLKVKYILGKAKDRWQLVDYVSGI